ncbi:hypothetical protein ACIQI7_32165 [Kitasatospora sp. NPDC092039]|uniref:hypothetical protein n=1 Tax=Kitasatospora sp. NPDC092039 TaxID=3364086 RepID=UPI0037FBE76E
MDSTTLIGLVGIGATALGTIVGARTGAAGATRSAQITSQGQVQLANQAARRQLYTDAVTTLMACQATVDSVIALAARRTRAADGPDCRDDVQFHLQHAEPALAAFRRHAAAINVEGPHYVARAANTALNASNEIVGRLREWIDDGRPLREFVPAAIEYAWEDQRTLQESVLGFAAACQHTLHPQESADLAPQRWSISRFRRQ